jgi:hypothetical protein
MELRPSWEAASGAAIQELPNILCSSELYYCFYTNLLLVPLLSQLSPFHITHSYLRSIITLSTRLRLGFPSSLFPVHTSLQWNSISSS